MAFLHAPPAQFESHGEMIRFYFKDADYYRHAIEKSGREAWTGGQVDLKKCYLPHLRQDLRCTEVIEPDQDARPAHVAGSSSQPNEVRRWRRDMTEQGQ